ncbi:MAG: methylated-DNA--[protein]-cysteine S-methyltransferase [Candidatus Paceibacterota bacterium]|jgi:DNA polymerase
MKNLSPFSKKVLRAVKAIPSGSTLSYGEVARKVGNAGAARAVGTLMSHNLDLAVPCHRVIRADGKIGEYNGLRDAKGPKGKLAVLRAEKLEVIRDEVLALAESPLYSYRVENGYFPVIGEGSHTAHIMFVGEAPGETEAKTAKPFCGRSGKLLDELLASIKMDRASVYVTNLVKDRPQANRDPEPAEIALYAPFLERQIDIIQPKVIATLGRHSMKFVFEKYGLSAELRPISKIHGQVFQAIASYGPVTVVALYHPAAALYNGSMKPTLIEDFKVLSKYK